MTESVVAADARDDLDRAIVVDVDRWAALAQAVLSTEGASGELTLTFIDEDEMVELNARHMGADGPTDVLSFPIDDVDDDSLPGVPRLLGDIVICPDVADRQYADHAGSLDDEFALLVVHGVLHILGHDHAEPDETAVMRQRELELLQLHHWGGAPPPAFRQAHG